MFFLHFIQISSDFHLEKTEKEEYTGTYQKRQLLVEKSLLNILNTIILEYFYHEENIIQKPTSNLGSKTPMVEKMYTRSLS